jgi:hypothetical protein
VETFDRRKAAALSEEFRKRRVWQVPTLLVQRTYAYPPSGGFSRELWARYVSAAALDGYTKRLEAFRNAKTPEELEWQARSYHRETELVQTMVRAGVRFLVGTDADLFHASQDLACIGKWSCSPKRAWEPQAL